MPKKVFLFGSYSANVLLLDTYPANYAYSFRKLKTSYSGSCIRVRRSSDNAEQDIGFNGNYVDESALTTFVGSNSAYVTTWYDQSGNGVNKINTSSSQQPLIVSSGTVSKFGGFIGMQSNSGTAIGDRGLYNTVTGGGITSLAFNIFAINAFSECLPATNTNLSASRFYGVMQPNTSSPTQNSGTPNYYKNSTLISSPTRQTLYNNFNNTFSLMTTDQVNLSGWTVSSSKFPGYRGIDGYNMEEIVYFTSTSRTQIETNIKTYYAL